MARAVDMGIVSVLCLILHMCLNRNHNISSTNDFLNLINKTTATQSFKGHVVLSQINFKLMNYFNKDKLNTWVLWSTNVSSTEHYLKPAEYKPYIS